MVFLDWGKASNSPAFGRPTKNSREAGSLDIGQEPLEKSHWDKADTIGKHVRNFVFFFFRFCLAYISSSTIDGFRTVSHLKAAALAACASQELTFQFATSFFGMFQMDLN